jgi:hypothetical protein
MLGFTVRQKRLGGGRERKVQPSEIQQRTGAEIEESRGHSGETAVQSGIEAG